MSTPKGQQRPDAPDTMNLMDLLVHKDKEIKESLKTGITVHDFHKSNTLVIFNLSH